MRYVLALMYGLCLGVVLTTEAKPRPPALAVPAPAPPAPPPPGLPAPGSAPDLCPVCGWSPCTDSCRLGLSQYDVELLREQFREEFNDGDPEAL